MRVLSGGQADQRQHVGVAHGQQYSTPPPPYNRIGLGVQSAGTPGQQSHQGAGFQGMTVQLLLEAQARHFEQELAKQREAVRIVQQHLIQQLLPYPVVEGLVWGPRHSY